MPAISTECRAPYYGNYLCDNVLNQLCSPSSSSFTRIVRIALPLVSLLVFIFTLFFVYKYYSSAKKRIRDINQLKFQPKVVRDRSGTSKTKIRCLELDPSFVNKIKDKWSVMSLGQYLSQLRPSESNSSGEEGYDAFLKKEFELSLSKTIVGALGKTYGGVLLPILGSHIVDSALSKISSFVSDKILSEKETVIEDTIEDIAALDFALPELVSVLNINQKLYAPDFNKVQSSMDIFQLGEVGYGDLSFNNKEKYEQGLPNPFVVERDFKKFIADMEEQTKGANGGVYDPNDKSLAPPTPINERILPDLYFGVAAECTHTKRECIENRLVALLLTKLSYNFYKKQHDKKDIFEVHWNYKKCRFPEHFIEALIQNGHKVEVCPKVTNAAFGFFLCVKEKDGFVNIPTCVQIRTGVERSSDNCPSYFIAPHGGLEVNITGPFIGTTNYCALQFYVCADGLTAFYANQDVDVPWLERAPLSRMYTKDESIRAMRMAGMIAYVYNKISTDMNLPCGGYGVLGMCNDSATIIDYAIRGETTAYPLLGTGRYLNHILNFLVNMKFDFSKDEEMVEAVNDLKLLVKASIKMPNDLHVSPATIIDCSDRFNKVYSKCVFQKTQESKAVMTEMAEKCKAFYGL